jgi:hypothetical protein
LGDVLAELRRHLIPPHLLELEGAERADHEERRWDHGDDEPERDRARLNEQVLISELLPDRGG